MGLFQKRHGTVSIFLVIVLVPVIVVTSIFVDVSRVQLAKSVVASAADLSLNTVLTQYDEDLNEFYGMLGSCQNINDFYETAEDYYKKSLVSQGLSEGEADSAADQLIGMIQGKSDVNDLLKIGWEDEKEAVSVKPVENANLANPTILKKQIVEFMKYRSPANGVIDLIDSLTNSKKELKEAEDNTELIDKREEYFECENEVMEKAYEIYKEIRKYEELGIDKDYIKNLRQDLLSVKGEYLNIDSKLIRDLYNTENVDEFTLLVIHTAPSVDETYHEKNKASASNLEDRIDDCCQELREFGQARKSMENACVLNYKENDTYKVQYWVQQLELVRDSNRYEKYVKAANYLFESVEKLKNAYENRVEKAEEEEYTQRNTEYVNTKGKKKISEHYDSIVSQCEQIERDYIAGENDSVALTIEQLFVFGSQTFQDRNPAETDTKVQQIQQKLQDYKDKLTEANKILKSIRKEVKSLQKLVKDYQDAKNAWVETTNSIDTELAKQDRDEIKDLSQEEKIMKSVTDENVTELIQRLDASKGVNETVTTGVHNYKYNGTRIIDLKNLSAVKGVSGIDSSRIVTDKTALYAYVKERAENIAEESENIKELKVTEDNNPAIGQVKTPELYTWIRSNCGFESLTEESYDQGKKDYKKYKDKKEEETDQADVEAGSETKKSKNEINKLENLPSKGEGADVSKQKTSEVSEVSGFLGSFLGDFGNTLENIGVTVRDDIYSVDYIMSMFSYDTYELEGRYAIYAKKNNGGNIDATLKNYKQKYVNPESITKTWQSTAVTDTYNKTLTNHMVDTKNNWSYGNEVEYILYGGSNVANKAAAYTRIYLLRYGLNVAPVFQKYWNDPDLDGLAAGISAATQGIIPNALIKVAIILAINIAETAYDLLCLKAGLPVKLLKKSDEIVISFSSLFEGGSQNEVCPTSGLYLQYSDYLKVFLFLKLCSESSADKVYQRTADVIQANMSHSEAVKNEKFLMNKAEVYYELQSNVKVEPLLLKIKWMKEQDSVLENLDWCKLKHKTIRGY